MQFFSRQFNILKSDNRFSEILTGSVVSLSARVIGTGLALLVSIIVARSYGPESLGMLAMVQAFMLMAAVFASLGTNVSILRLIPEHLAKYSAASAYHVYVKSQRLVALVSVLLGGALCLASDVIAEKIFTKPELAFALALTSACIIFKALLDFNTESLRGLRVIRAYAFMQVLPHLTMLLALLTMLVLSRHAIDPVIAQISAWGLAAVIAAMLAKRQFSERIHDEDLVHPLSLGRLIGLSAPMLMTASMNFIIAQMGILILGMYCTASDVGHYAVAVKMATLTSFVLQAINSMAAPKFSELFHSGKMDDLFFVAKRSAKLIFWTTTPILLVLVVFGQSLLAFFGDGFPSAYIPMIILVVGQFVNSISGSTGYFMNMTGNQITFRNIILIASALNLILCFLLIPRIGLYGAAVAGALSLSLWNIWTLLYIKIYYGHSIGYIPLPRFLFR